MRQKTGWKPRQEVKRRGTGRNPNHGTCAQKWGQVTGFATGKLQKYLQQSFRVLEFS